MKTWLLQSADPADFVKPNHDGAPSDALERGKPVLQLALADPKPTAASPRLDLVPTFPPAPVFYISVSRTWSMKARTRRLGRRL